MGSETRMLAEDDFRGWTTGPDSDSDDGETLPLARRASLQLLAQSRTRRLLVVGTALVIGTVLALCVAVTYERAPAENISARRLLESAAVAEITTDHLAESQRIFHQPEAHSRRTNQQRVANGFKQFIHQLKKDNPPIARALESITLDAHARDTVLHRMRYHGDTRLQRVGLEVARAVQESSGQDKAALKHNILRRLQPRMAELRLLREEIFPAGQSSLRSGRARPSGKSAWDTILHPSHIRLMKTFDEGWDKLLGVESTRRLKDSTTVVADATEAEDGSSPTWVTIGEVTEAPTAVEPTEAPATLPPLTTLEVTLPPTTTEGSFVTINPAPSHILPVVLPTFMPTVLPFVDNAESGLVTHVNFTEIFACVVSAKGFLDAYKGIVEEGFKAEDAGDSHAVLDDIEGADAMLDIMICALAALQEFKETKSDPLGALLACPQTLGVTGTNAIAALLYDGGVDGASYGFMTTPPAPSEEPYS